MATRRSGPAGAFYARMGGELRRRRTALGLKQEDLALRVQLSRASIANVEGGRQAIPVHHLVELAEALETAASDILRAAEAKSDGAAVQLPAETPKPVREFVRNLRGAP
jgi:transcriptional regulator with XRE-family HTH domain